jgi:16S rRNA (cytosine967-C5)-methyltransferase
MRLHRNLVFAVINTLDSIFNEGAYADKAISKTLKQDARWGSRDRSFIAETSYDIVRWKRLYSEIADINQHYSRTNLFRLFTVWATLRGIEIPDWKQFEDTPTRRIKGKFDELSSIRKYRESIPDWLDQLGEEQLGEVWEKEIAALNEQAPVILRVNTLQTNKAKLQIELEKEGIETLFIDQQPDALQLIKRANVFSTTSFAKGWFEVQDASSHRVSKYLAPKPGMRVVDTCAGAGGKTLHLAAIMENKGQLIALDIFPQKLKELKRRAKRAGAHNIETRLIDTTKVIKKLHETADAVLIDAPCTGLGVLRRNPDAKWKLKPEFIEEITTKQRELLRDYSKMLKTGGTLVYATCSILPMENQDQVKHFLASEEGAQFQLAKEEKVLVSESGHDGFYMAKLLKK